MYEFYYKYIRTKYNNHAKLLFTDTDSLNFETEANDVYDYFYEDKELFGFSDYGKDSKFFDSVNKKVVSKMKEELKGKIISKFVVLKSKMYYLIDVDTETK